MVVGSRSGLIRVFSGREYYTLDSPRLRHCEATAEGVVCLTDELVVFLDPLTPSTIRAEFRNSEVRDELAELVVSPWYEGCRLSITPRLIQVHERELRGEALHVRLYPRMLGWEGPVKAHVDCPTHYRVVEGYVRSGNVVVERVVAKSIFVATSGRLLGSPGHNCAGRVTLRFLNLFPLPVPVKVEVSGIEDASASADKDSIHPGPDEISVRFSGRCPGEGWALVRVLADPLLLESGELAAVYVDLGGGQRIEQDLTREVEVVNLWHKSIVRAPGSSLRLSCLNGEVFEGRDYLLVERCEAVSYTHLTLPTSDLV